MVLGGCRSFLLLVTTYINAAIDMFFTKETPAASCAMGKEKKARMELATRH